MGKSRIYNKEFSEKCVHHGLGRKKYNIKRAIELLKPSKKDTILGIGCDNGELVNELTPYVKKMIGIDLNKEVIEALHNKNLLHMDATKIDFRNESFDKIVCLHTLEHIKDLKRVFSEMERILKPGGIVVATYPFELIRGLNIIAGACRLYGNPLCARELHVHRLSPEKIAGLTSLNIIKKGVFFWTLSHILYCTKKRNWVTLATC